MKPLAACALALLLVGCGRSSLVGGGGSGGSAGFGGGDMQFGGGDMAPVVGNDLATDPCATDCSLPQCQGNVHCHVPGTEICNNGIDDNDNGLIDCADPECKDFPGCMKHTCDPNHVDCTDPLCNDVPQCKNLACMPTVDFGTLMPMGSTSTQIENTTGTKDVDVTPCAPGGGGMVVGQFTLTGTSDVTLAFFQAAGEDHVFGIYRAGVDQTCAANPVETCYDPKGAGSGQHAFTALAAGQYYVITQAFEVKGQGIVQVTLSTPSAVEICNNGIDDNGNGLIDCADEECINAPNCVSQECKPDFNVGALVVNGPPAVVSFNTVNYGSDDNLTCQAAPGGDDVVVRFTLHEAAGILLDWSQNGDHVVALMHTPPPGEACDADPIECYDPSDRKSGEVAWPNQPAGDYEFIFKATKPGDEGEINAQISAYQTRPVELCHNGIDDNNNGLIDCADPECFGVAGCAGPYCMPDVQLGTMAVGESRTVTVDTTMGTAAYNVSCAQGGGKGIVIQLDVPAGGTNGGFGLGFDCTQAGDNVLDLFAAGGPRDACDVDELTCADPSTLPFGCGYEVPNLQPGTYNVIVDAFKAGAEGSMMLTLTVDDDRQLEICNNGIDDDGNGLIDCADPKCVTSQYCLGAQCKPDATIDPMPLDGSTVSKLVQTSGAKSTANNSCASATMTPNAVIALRLTAKANLSATWNQLGNHDLQLFTDAGPMLPCGAGTGGQCVKTNDAATGTAQFTNVPAGLYYLIVSADSAATAGSISLELSGMPAP
jgi:hypothetical protein